MTTRKDMVDFQAYLNNLENSTTKNQANGYAGLDGSAKIPTSILPDLSTTYTTVALKGVANGLATLDGTGKVPTTQLPSYVDDVVEGATLAAFPATGETGKIYVALNTNKTYRWSGSAYVFITSGAVDSVAGKTGVVTLTQADIANTGLVYDIIGSTYGAPAASQVDVRFYAGRAFTIPANLAGSIVKAGVAATASKTFNVQKNNVTVASFTFAAAGTTATFTTQAAISFAVGDKFSIVAPALTDATIADIDYFIMGQLT